MANIARRPDGTWRARYRDDGGKEHARHFDRKLDAQRWLDEVTATVVTGTYVDPKAGRVTLAAFYATWAARQVWAPGTDLAMSLAVRCATFRDVELRSLRRSHVEQWVKHMVAAGLAPGTVHTRVQNVRSVLRGAVRDRLIATDPGEGVPLPRRRRRAQAMTIPTAGCSARRTGPHRTRTPSGTSGARRPERAAWRACGFTTSGTSTRRG